MDDNIEMLNYIYQNAQMGQDTVNHLLHLAQDEPFKKLLNSQFNEYKNIFDKSEQELERHGKTAKDISALTKISSSMMIDAKTLTDKSPSHICEMMIRGGTMGIIDMTKKLKEYRQADPDVRSLGDRLLAFELRNMEECRKFL